MREVKSPTRKMTVWPSCWKVPQLAHQHGVAQVQVGRGGVKARFDAQGAIGFAAFFEALTQVGDANNLCRTLLQEIHLFVNG